MQQHPACPLFAVSMSSRRITSLFQQQKKSSELGAYKGGVAKKDAAPKQPAAKRKGRAAAVESEEAQEERDLVLKKFDLATKYGPCIGMTRLERWERAKELGLSPPADVQKVLQELLTTSNKGPDELLENKCLWEDRI